MILADTSVWVDHFRRSNSRLIRYLEEGVVGCHDFVIGELACGNFKNRQETLNLLRELPRLLPAQHEEALEFVDSHRLCGKGIGWIDIHLLASARLNRAKLWTLDKRLETVAAALDVSTPR